MVAQSNETNNQTEKDLYYREKQKKDIKHQIFTFVMLVMFTLISFGLVLSEVPSTFTIPIILVMAGVQVLFQFFYFMHMNSKGHDWPIIMIFSGIFAAFLTILGLTTIVWWG